VEAVARQYPTQPATRVARVNLGPGASSTEASGVAKCANRLEANERRNCLTAWRTMFMSFPTREAEVGARRSFSSAPLLRPMVVPAPTATHKE
jgi:hypothetical protein